MVVVVMGWVKVVHNGLVLNPLRLLQLLQLFLLLLLLRRRRRRRQPRVITFLDRGRRRGRLKRGRLMMLDLGTGVP